MRISEECWDLATNLNAAAVSSSVITNSEFDLTIDYYLSFSIITSIF